MTAALLYLCSCCTLYETPWSDSGGCCSINQHQTPTKALPILFAVKLTVSHPQTQRTVLLSVSSSCCTRALSSPSYYHPEQTHLASNFTDDDNKAVAQIIASIALNITDELQRHLTLVCCGHRRRGLPLEKSNRYPDKQARVCSAGCHCIVLHSIILLCFSGCVVLFAFDWNMSVLRE